MVPRRSVCRLFLQKWAELKQALRVLGKLPVTHVLKLTVVCCQGLVLQSCIIHILGVMQAVVFLRPDKEAAVEVLRNYQRLSGLRALETVVCA